MSFEACFLARKLMSIQLLYVEKNVVAILYICLRFIDSCFFFAVLIVNPNFPTAINNKKVFKRRLGFV